MLVVETIARIRREHFIKGKTIKEIARDLKVSRNTVRKVLRSGETSFEYERNVQPRPKLGRWTADLEQVLAANAAEPARECRKVRQTRLVCQEYPPIPQKMSHQMFPPTRMNYPFPIQPDARVSASTRSTITGRRRCSTK